MPKTPQVAFITGGANGIGQAVAQALIARGGWNVHVVDIQDDAGPLSSSVSYYKADTSNYQQLADAFKAAFASSAGRLDFVFANAGVLEKPGWFAKSESPSEPPPEPDWTALEINLKGCMNAVRVGRHYMAQASNGGSIVVTSSVAGIWPMYCSPVYTSSKHGVVGFMRSIADWYYTSENIRVNALCPSSVKTAIMPDNAWDQYDKTSFTPLNVVAQLVLKLVDGERIVDAKTGVQAEKNYGQTVTLSAGKFYLTDKPDYCDDSLQSVVEATHVKNMIGVLV